ncbi:armadillo-type protein [Glomus cerebriforme]|uniref:Armadillo-type protein n=1 Tax=Glomus cerebriforme TaxID=658196 RepID=A0A397TSE3_9GLOM|nr:armadillo-type protein [Glomus cerebriforme]
MQFMNVCKDKPENLPALDAIGMDEPKDDKKNSRTSNSRTSTGSRPMHKGSPNQSQFSSMGEFKLPKTTSEERFAASLRNGTSTGIFGRTPLGRTGSGSTLLPAPSMSSTVNPPSPRTSSGRRDNRRNVKSGYQMQGPNVGQEQVAPLERSENRWVPSIFDTILPKATDDFIPIESVQRKVKALLNKLTLEKFDSISDQIIDYANKSRDERDGRILREVIRLIFEKSCDESNFCAMYAQLCRKMMERVDPEIVDENVRNTEGKFVQGGTLFRKYLLNRCQEEFEKGWKVNIPLPSNEKGEPDLMSDEYYAAAKAKRQGLGLIRFIGELFKLNMLTERIMHECIKKLIIVQGSPEEAEMESLCKLMNTVGEQLDHIKPNPHEQIKSNQIDHTKAKKYMDSYFERLEDISKLPNLSSRIKFMIMDLIDLRSNVWKPRRDINAPKTIAEIHEDAAKQKEDDYMKRTTSSGGRGMPKFAEQMSRSGSGRREHRSDKGMGPHGSSASGNDGWSTVGGSSSQRNKVGDLTKFGSVTRSKITGSVNLAPGGILGSLSGGAKGWINKNDNKDREDKAIGLSRTNSTTNMYSVLTADSSEGRKSSESEAQKPSPPMERKKIILAPRTKGITNEDSQAADKPASKSTSEGASSVQSMPEELATKRINNMMEEYFSILDDREVILCLKEIPTEYHAKAIESFANKVIEKKQKDVDNVVKLFKEIVSSGTCDTDTFKNGFKATLEFLMDIGADAPMAYSFTGQLLFSAGLDFRDITKLLKPLDDDMAIEKIVKGYASALKNKDEQKYVQKINEFEFKTLFPLKSKDDINKFLEDLGGSSKK